VNAVRRAPPIVAVSAIALLQHAFADDYTPSIAEVTVNGETGPALVVERDAAGTPFVAESALPQLRLRTPESGAVTIDGERYYSVAAFNPSDVAMDDATQSLRLTLPAAAFVPTRSDYASDSVPHVTPAQLGGFVNYDLLGERVGDQSNVGAIVEAGAFGACGVLTSSALAQRVDSRGSAVRLDSTWTLDMPDRLETLRVGDWASSTGAWGQAVRFGGVHFGTNFATQPTLVTTPLLSAKGEAVLPSTIDVFVNGQHDSQENVAPGPFSIDRVPAINGAGQMQVIVTDALGRQQVLTQPYYTGPALLRAGLDEYSFDAGAVRENYTTSSNDYGDFVAAATYRRGLSDEVTAEVHAEGEAGGSHAIGFDTAIQVGDLGVTSLTTAFGGDGRLGWLGGVGFERSSTYLDVFAEVRYASDEFAQLGSDATTQRPKQRTFGGLGFNFGDYGNLRLSYGRQTYWTDATAADVYGISHSVTLGAYGYLNFLASRTSGDGASTDVFVNWTLPLGGRRTASVGAQRADGKSLEAVASIQQSLPVGSGTGYYVATTSNGDGQIDYSYQGGAGLVSAEYARRDGIDGWRANATGGIALTSAGVMPARTLNESFAVVELADYPDLTVYLDNQPIGRTDEKGRVLLDSMRPYQTNTISVDPKEIPFDASLDTPSMTVTPAYRSGPVVRFPVTRASAATLRLVQGDGAPVPAGAIVTTANEHAPVGGDGLVYLTAVDGAAAATAEWSGHHCAFRVVRPRDGGVQPDLGDVVCAATKTVPTATNAPPTSARR